MPGVNEEMNYDLSGPVIIAGTQYDDYNCHYKHNPRYQSRINCKTFQKNFGMFIWKIIDKWLTCSLDTKKGIYTEIHHSRLIEETKD